jgi:hypothetical protein
MDRSYEATREEHEHKRIPQWTASLLTLYIMYMRLKFSHNLTTALSLLKFLFI